MFYNHHDLNNRLNWLSYNILRSESHSIWSYVTSSLESYIRFCTLRNRCTIQLAGWTYNVLYCFHAVINMKQCVHTNFLPVVISVSMLISLNSCLIKRLNRHGSSYIKQYAAVTKILINNYYL